MKIKSIQIGAVSIPLKKPFKTALRIATSMEDIIIKVIADNGAIGYGTAAPTAVITGDTRGSIIEAIQTFIGPKLIGERIDELENIMAIINKSALRNSSAKAALDMACYDLFGQQFKLPLYKLFGGASNFTYTDITVSVNSPEEMAQDASEYVADGFTELKLKVGTDSRVDIERVRAIRKAVGYDIKIRCDANQGWQPKEAVRTIRAFEDGGFAIELVEQPVVAHDIEGLKFVTDNVATDIMADEAIFSPWDAMRVLNTRAADLINIKLMKAGGLYNAQKIAAMAETFGMEVMVGCMMESAVGAGAAAAFAAGKRCVTRTDLDAPLLTSGNPVVGGATFASRTITLPDAPGMGITDIVGWEKIAEIN
ncbi:MAG: dipeptide epimerase [Negativicutes bacterium]|jgi:o-succinylbenzoate synthase